MSAAQLSLVLTLAAAGTPATGQISAEDVIDPGPRSEEVESALAWQRVETEVTYLGPSADYRPGEAQNIELPEPEPTPEEASTEARWNIGIIVGLILIGIIALIVLFGGKMSVSFRRTDNSIRKRVDATDAARGTRTPLPADGLLDHLAAMADRREALILLTGQALEQAARMNGLTLARAQTARDVVRTLPREWTHIDAIRRLVREAEIVHFGGRDLADETWQACLAAAQPLFADPRPA